MRSKNILQAALFLHYTLINTLTLVHGYGLQVQHSQRLSKTRDLRLRGFGESIRSPYTYSPAQNNEDFGERIKERSNLLTSEEETEIALKIRSFQSVMKVRESLVDWMARDNQSQDNELNNFQWAAACKLTVEELEEIISEGDEARTKLLKGNVGLVKGIAKRYYGMLKRGDMKLDDLIQEGYVGIMEAAERFDHTLGYKFSTYATYWIKQRILRSEGSRMIRLPAHVQTMIRQMNKKNKEWKETVGRTPSDAEMAHELNVPIEKVHKYQSMNQHVLSLESPVDRHSTDDTRTIGDRVADTTSEEDFPSQELIGEVHLLLGALDDDERLILTHRFGLDDGKPKSRRAIALTLDISSDVVRRVEASALHKLRQPQISYRLRDYVKGDDKFSFETSDSYSYHQNNISVMNEQATQEYHRFQHPIQEVTTDDIWASPERIWAV